jgi:mannose-6-phosphate isomerase-like protein (cupin superfamily)
MTATLIRDGCIVRLGGRALGCRGQRSSAGPLLPSGACPLGSADGAQRSALSSDLGGKYAAPGRSSGGGLGAIVLRRRSGRIRSQLSRRIAPGSPEDIVWHQTDLGRNFWLSDNMVGSDYTSAFSAQVSKFGPGGGSPPHSHTYNHAFYFPSGSGSVQIGEQVLPTTPGTSVKVSAHERHSVTNSGGEGLIFLVIYDPPNIDGTP